MFLKEKMEDLCRFPSSEGGLRRLDGVTEFSVVLGSYAGF